MPDFQHFSNLTEVRVNGVKPIAVRGESLSRILECGRVEVQTKYASVQRAGENGFTVPTKANRAVERLRRTGAAKASR